MFIATTWFAFHRYNKRQKVAISSQWPRHLFALQPNLSWDQVGSTTNLQTPRRLSRSENRFTQQFSAVFCWLVIWGASRPFLHQLLQSSPFLHQLLQSSPFLHQLLQSSSMLLNMLPQFAVEAHRAKTGHSTEWHAVIYYWLFESHPNWDIADTGRYCTTKRAQRTAQIQSGIPSRIQQWTPPLRVHIGLPEPPPQRLVSRALSITILLH